MSSARVCHACHSEELEHHASIDTFTVGIEYSDDKLRELDATELEGQLGGRGNHIPHDRLS